MYEHILQQDLIHFVGDRMLFYSPKRKCHVYIDKIHEWHSISTLFSEKVCLEIEPKDISFILTKLHTTATLQIRESKLNAKTDFINVKNGAINFQTFQPNNSVYSDDWFTYQINAKYIPNANLSNAPYFQKFCETSLENDESKIQLLLEIIGYLCSPLCNAKKAFILLGEPNSGKSLILHLIEYLIGEEYISNIPLEKLGARFSTATLSQKLVNICGELSAEPLRNIETFKLLVGGDLMVGEFKGRNIFHFHNRCKLLFAANVLPPVKSEDVSAAFVNRIVLLRFPKSIPEEERIYDLLEKMRSESDIIFSLAIQALSKLVSRNLKFTEAEDSKKLLDDYAFQQTNIDIFVQEHCVLGKEYKIHSKDIYKAYVSFCTYNTIKPIKL